MDQMLESKVWKRARVTQMQTYNASFVVLLCRLLLVTYHIGLFLTLLLGQVGVQGRKQGYW